MNSAEGFILGAGGIAFAGNFKESGGFPSNGYAILGATVALVFLASFSNGTPLEKPAKALAGLTLLVAAIRYIPGLSTTKKGKHHG